MKEYISIETRDMFEGLLNEVKRFAQILDLRIGLGSLLRKEKEKEFITLYNQWLSACQERNLIRQTLSTRQSRKHHWDTRKDINNERRKVLARLLNGK
ncbi:MAG: hypothetical protein Unbinned8261contig1001_51 [Prokaryotic dsDNA virus sp.]|nr:MAG: hypothetical protein Unbinned8261contig1001_51 [Prokaryotic dsDNA virus sp.]|tara:strand:- start:88 stop:381 length:294 start_codon:yes stop_codon:yes gene_type:complete